MKKIYCYCLIAVMVSMLTFLAESVFAKEYQIEKAKAVFSIPDEYLVATRDNIPDSVVQRTGITKQQLLEYFNQSVNKSSTVLIAYHNDHTLYIHVAEDEGAKKIVDYLTMPEENFTDSKVLELLRKKIEDETNWYVNSVKYQKIGDARYHVADGFSVNNNEKFYAKYYITIKNSLTIGITAISAIPDNRNMDKGLDYILKKVKYNDTNSKNGNAATKNQSVQKKPTQVNNNKDKSSASTSGNPLFIALFTIIAIIEQYCCLRQAALLKINKYIDCGIDLRRLVIPIWFNITWLTPIVQIFLLTKIFQTFPWYYCLGIYILYFLACAILLPVPKSMYSNAVKAIRNKIDDPAWRTEAEHNGLSYDFLCALSEDLYDLQFKLDTLKKKIF